MKKFLIFFVSILAVSSLTLTSCHSGDDDPIIVDNDGNDNDPDNDKDDTDKVDNDELVSPDVPKAEGWSGDNTDGILKYSPDGYYEDDVNSYFAFEVKKGKCQKGVYNVVMPTAAQAKQLASMLNDGTWIGDIELENLYRPQSRSGVNSLTDRALRHIQKFNRTRAGFTLPIPVTCNGRVLYISLPNIKGIDVSDLEDVMDYWNGYSYVVPDHVLFGTYENGVYKCKNMHGLNIDYLVETKFNNGGICVKYTTTISFPTDDWAEFYYMAYEEQLDDFENTFGRRPDLKKEGKKIILDAVIIGDVTRKDINDLIYALDWMNNCPFLYNLFQ